MQLHNLIEKCVEWVALDGILGTEPLVLHQHLRKSDPSLDDAYFAYLFTVLVENPCIRVSLTEEPLAAPDKTIRLGDAPLPDDYQIPESTRNDVDLNALYINGVKGRQLAFHLAGMPFTSNSEAIEARRDIQKHNALVERSAALRRERDERKKLPQVSPEEGLIWNLEQDDGAGIAKEDLNGLAQRWGSRLRLRCTNEETYYRLTGSHAKNPKITPIVYQTLQLAAKSREKGITAIELGPLVGASQGSMHHYMKVLTTMGLCAKVPTIIHGALTNLLVFHSFLEQNENYKATKSEATVEPPTQPGVTGSVEAEEADDPSIAPGPATASDWGLTFTDLNEEQLMNGFILRERLVKLLDHPSLTNHLLRAKNLLPLLGWKSIAGLRHRRSVPRAVRALIESGQVEYVDVGEKKVRCIRLTRYNPDRAPRARPVEVPTDASTESQDLGQLVQRYSQPVSILNGVTSLQSIPYQIGDVILRSGSEGMRIIDIRDSLSGLFRRIVEFHFARYEKMTSPPLHLQHRRITSVIESFGRERRLRAFSLAEHRAYLTRNNEPINDKIYPPIPRQAGHFAELSHLPFYADLKKYDKHTDKLGTPVQGVKISDFEDKANKAKAKRPRSATPTAIVDMTADDDDADQLAQVAPKPQKPQNKSSTKASYGQEAQIRGRPRKYIHVVGMDGKVERTIIGSVLPHADLAPIWIYLPHLDKLVPAHVSYSGVGEPPEPEEEELNQARTPESFIKYPRARGAKPPNMTRRNALMKTLGSASQTKRKQPAKEDYSGEDDARRSKRPRPVKPLEQDIDELLSDDEDDFAIIEQNETAPVGNAPSAGPSGSRLRPVEPLPRVAPLDKVSLPVAPTPVQVEVGQPPESQDGLVDPALDQSETHLENDSQVPESDLDPDLGAASSTPPLVPINIEPSVGPTAESQASPVPRQVTSAPSDRAPLRQVSPQSSTAPGVSSPQLPSYQPMEVARSRSPPLREMSNPVNHAAAVPHTPSHQYSPPQAQYYTPPGVQSYTILPPVVYVPPGYTVWPPLPPGYPTTDIPPPSSSPFNAPPPPAPGFWNHGPQHQPYGVQHQAPHFQHQPPMIPAHPAHMDTPSRHESRRSHLSMAPSPRDMTTRSASPVPGGLVTDSPGAESSSPPARVSSRQRDPATLTRPSNGLRSRNPISRLQSGEVTRTPGPSAAPRSPTREKPDQSTPVRESMQPLATQPPDESVPATPMRISLPERSITPLADITSDAPTEKASFDIPVDSSQAGMSSTLTLNSFELTPIRAPKRARKGRMDLGVIRRANEMLTVLQEAGGVYEEHALWKLHQEWSFRVAGTDVPHAPNIGATMDRQVWKRLMQSTKDDGRTSDTVSVVPTSTAAWRNYRIIWLIDTPKEKVDGYMRGLANTIKQATAPKPVVSTPVPHMQYTEVKLPPRHPSSTVQHHASEIVDEECRGLTGDERRHALCKDPLVLSQLYGRQSGKWARTNLFHLAIRNTVQTSDSTSILDRSAGVFMAPMISQDISIGAFYAVVMTHERDEALLEWLKSPANRTTPVKEVPFDIRINHDQRRQRTHTRIREHVTMLLALRLISPLSISTDSSDTYVTIDTPQMPHASFKIDTKEVTGQAVTYVIHDWAPIYHVAATVPALLGYLPVRTEDEINKFWDTYRIACREVFVERIPEITPRSSIESRNLADSPQVLNISSGWKQTMRQSHRWTNAVRLLPVQRDALNETVNWTEATSNLKSADQLAALAWEFALPEEAVRDHYEARLQKAIEAKSKREKRTQAMDEALSARHVKAQRALAFKLSERQAQSKRTWEERVAGICDRLLVQFDHQLLDHVSRQSLTSMSKGFLTNEMIERIIRQYFSHRLIQSVKNNVPPPSMPVQAVPVVRSKGPKALVKKDQSYKHPGTRYRRKWSAEDDEILVDAEAIIRARNRDRPHSQKTKIGPERMFPGSLPVSCQTRVKKVVNTPEKEAYLTLLEEAWYEIWMKHSEDLKDDHPEHNDEFDIQEHIDYLRKNVNKTEMRVEAQAIANRRGHGVKNELAPELPDKLPRILSEFRWQHLKISRPRFDMVWQANNSQDARMGQVGSLSLLRPQEKLDIIPTMPDLAKFKLRAILKMIIATNPSQYTQPAAIALLGDYDQHAAVNPEILKMQQEKILVRHSSASSTGRFYSFASAWDTLRLGPFTDDFYQDAARLEDKVSAPGGLEWPVIGSSGELASLMNMVSAQTVEFEFDPEDFPTVVGGLGLQNTRRLNDISFEFGIKVKKSADPAPTAQPPSIYHCPTPRSWQSDSSEADLSRLYTEVGKAGPDGISKPELQTALGISRNELHRLLAALPDNRVPPTTFWAGYDTARLVYHFFWSEWQCSARQIKVEDDGRIHPEGEGEVRCTPRIWVDIWGRRLDEKWEEAVGCAKGWLVSRPGMSERIFREKLGVVMDRLEVNEVLQFLLDKGSAQRVWLDEREGIVPPVEAVDVDEEENIIWRPEPKRLLA